MSDPNRVFPQGSQPAAAPAPGEQHGNIAHSEHGDEHDRIVAFCVAHAPKPSEGFSAFSTEEMVKAAGAFGLGGSTISTILALVQQFGPSILQAIPQILALLKKPTPTPSA